jgi:hypothetical protein
MKPILLFCICILSLQIYPLAQVYQFTSDKEGVVKLHSTNIQYFNKNILITVDTNKKNIKLVAGQQKKEFNIILADSALLDKEGGKILKYQCIDKEGSKHNIVLMIYSAIIQKMLSVAGTLAISDSFETYSYELHKK